jgi:hypothetical protein
MLNTWTRIPLLIRIIIIVVLIALVMAGIWFVDQRLFWMALAGLGLVLLLLGMYWLTRKLIIWRKSRAMASDITERAKHAQAKNPEQQAKLERLRKAFLEGIQKFADAGKDIYSLPWYIVCGEPGSGKTETIRHSGVGFPAGLLDQMQGIGGTINMHWWFTNHAVILDTAGKMIFDEIPSGTNSEWVEFLTLLKTHRPNCPVNGLILVLPVDSLLKDSSEEIQRKAGRITNQLDRIQAVLDIRFPVYVIVTKCDLMHGFREFFADVKDPAMQQQMLGWSNPDPLDMPFRPSLVSAHLQEVANKLRQKRFTLLADPLPLAGTGHRLNEVDALFTLPSSIEEMGPALKQYLDVLFVVGEWSQKPLFLRGIYFTSSVIEGPALDTEMASVLGIPVQNVPDIGRRWERERTFFLKDIFLQKIFHERGLVTRASSTRALRRRRQLILVSVAAIGILSLLLVSKLSLSSLQRSVMAERDYWQAAATNWNGDLWHPIVVPDRPGSRNFVYMGDSTMTVAGRTITLVDFHEQLRRMADHGIDVPWVFTPVEKTLIGANRSRVRAQRIIFESSVVRPSLAATHAELASPNYIWDEKSAHDLALLMRLEGLIHLPVRDGERPMITGNEFFATTLAPVLGNRKVPESLPIIFDGTYNNGTATPEQWPGKWLSAGLSFSDNRPFAGAWDAFSTVVRNMRNEQRVALEQLHNTRVGIEDMLAKEKALQTAIALNPQPKDWQNQILQNYETLAASRATADALIQKTGQLENMPATIFTLQEAQRTLVEHIRNRNKAMAKVLNDEIDLFRPAMERAEHQGIAIQSFTLLRDIDKRLKEIEAAIDAAATDFMADNARAEIPKLDMMAMVPAAETTRRVYQYRIDLYRDTIAQVFRNLVPQEPLLGRLADAYSRQNSVLASLKGQADKYDGALRADFVQSINLLRAWADKEGPVALAEAYGRELDQLLADNGGYPLIRTAATGLQQSQASALYSDLQKIAVDPKLDEVPLMARKAYETSSTRAQRFRNFMTAVTKPSGEANMVRISIAGQPDQQRIIERLYRDSVFTQVFAGFVFRTLRMGDKTMRTQVAETTEILAMPMSGALPPLEFFLGADAKDTPDAEAPLPGSWGVFRLMLNKGIRLPEGEGRTWLCPVEFDDGEGKRCLVLTLQFETPLPEIEFWP